MKTPEEIKKGLEYLSIKDIVKKLDMWKEGIAYDYAEDAALDALAYIRQLEAQAPKWIGVEKPPKESGEYIILIRYPDGRYIKTWSIFHPDAGWCPTDFVEAVQTHWMSFYALPEPPKED